MVVSVAMACIAAEGAGRYVNRDLTTTGDNASYWARRWQRDHVRLNDAGFRERQIAPVEAGVFRIAVVGDSYTFGQGVEEADRFSNLVEDSLNRERRGFEVLNFGRAGAETIDEIKIVETAIDVARPHFILLQWLVNDVEGEDKEGRPEPWPLLPAGPDRWLHRRSALYYLLSSGWGALQEKAGWVGTYADYMRARFGDPAGPDWREAEGALADLVRVCRRSGLPVGFVLFPSIESIRSDASGLEFLHDRVLDYCRRESLDCLDLRAALRLGLPVGSLVVNRYDSHPGAKAHRIAASAIEAYFGPRWRRMVDASPTTIRGPEEGHMSIGSQPGSRPSRPR